MIHEALYSLHKNTHLENIVKPSTFDRSDDNPFGYECTTHFVFEPAFQVQLVWFCCRSGVDDLRQSYTVRRNVC